MAINHIEKISWCINFTNHNSTDATDVSFQAKPYLSQKEKTIVYCNSHTTAGRKQGLINLQLQFSIYYTSIKKIEVNQQIKFNLLYISQRDDKGSFT